MDPKAKLNNRRVEGYLSLHSSGRFVNRATQAEKQVQAKEKVKAMRELAGKQ